MYSTGVPTSLVNLLQSLAIFAGANGWTVDQSGADALYAWRLSMHKGTCYVSVATPLSSTTLVQNGATGYTGAANINGEPNASPLGTRTDVLTAPFTGYHFFTSSDDDVAYLHVVVEISAGIFRHVHIGQLLALGGAAPCIYISAANWLHDAFQSYPDNANQNFIPWSAISGNTGLLCSVDGNLRWFSQDAASPGRLGGLPAQGNGFQQRGWGRSPNSFNGLAPLFPLGVFAERAVGNLWSPVGNVADAAFVNVLDFNPKDEITIGADTWKVFPVIAKGNVQNINGGPPSSGTYGFAYRKNA